MISPHSSPSFYSLECGICLSQKDEKANETTLFSYPTIIPCCKKDVHLLCLKEWFKRKASCPFCRKEKMFSKEGKLLLMQKLYTDQKILPPTEEQLISDFDQVLPISDTIIIIKSSSEDLLANNNYSSCQAIALIGLFALGLSFISTLVLPIYQS